jgi:FAR1 DNA-binding domain
MSLAPPPPRSYPDITTGFAALQAHAKAHGYALFQRDKRPTTVVYTCDRSGNYNPKGKELHTHSSKQRKATGSKKCGCSMKVVLRLDKISSTWSVEVLNPAHNHPPSTAITAHPAHRIAALSSDTCASIGILSRAGLSPIQILATLRDSEPNISLIPKDIANLAQKERLQQLEGMTPIQWLLKVYKHSTLPLPNLIDYRSFKIIAFSLSIIQKVAP